MEFTNIILSNPPTVHTIPGNAPLATVTIAEFMSFTFVVNNLNLNGKVRTQSLSETYSQLT